MNTLSKRSKEILEKLQRSYGLSIQSAINVLECVESYKDYDKLPAATTESLQVICDMFNVNFDFKELKRGRIALVGIWNELMSSYLYTDETLQDRQDKKHWKESGREYQLKANANNKLALYIRED